MISAVVNVLTNEEQALGLQQPAGIGQRPRPMCESPLDYLHFLVAENQDCLVNCVSLTIIYDLSLSH